MLVNIKLVFEITLYDTEPLVYGKENYIEQKIKKEMSSMFCRPLQYFTVHAASAVVFKGEYIREYYDFWKDCVEASHNIEKIIDTINFPNIYNRPLRIYGTSAELELLLTPTVSMGDSIKEVLDTVPKYLVDKELSDIAINRVARIEVLPADISGGA